MATSFVQWRGLTKLLEELTENIPQRASRDMAALTQQSGEDMLAAYRENLAGAVPSTEDSPLPVGMRSGQLYEGAQMEIVNQYSFNVFNDTDYAGWIEDGTIHMAPRHPLQDAVDQLEYDLDERLDEVMVGIIDE